jgi:hypothetical protein
MKQYLDRSHILFYRGTDKIIGTMLLQLELMQRDVLRYIFYKTYPIGYLAQRNVEK